MTPNAYHRLIRGDDKDTYCNATGHITLRGGASGATIEGGVCDCADREDYWAERDLKKFQKTS